MMGGPTSGASSTNATAYARVAAVNQTNAGRWCVIAATPLRRVPPDTERSISAPAPDSPKRTRYLVSLGVRVRSAV